VLVALGIGLGYGSLIGLAATGLLLLPALAHRIRVEESLLEKQFGEQYRAYQKRVRKLIPGLW
jgi:protein-S-isoprenylcysteine O-methyltransferase Ste14